MAKIWLLFVSPSVLIKPKSLFSRDPFCVSSNVSTYCYLAGQAVFEWELGRQPALPVCYPAILGLRNRSLPPFPCL